MLTALLVGTPFVCETRCVIRPKLGFKFFFIFVWFILDFEWNRHYRHPRRGAYFRVLIAGVLWRPVFLAWFMLLLE